MAKLSAHGKELLRIEQSFDVPQTDDSLTTWERVTRSYHADGKILQKHDCRFKPSTYDPKPGVYSYGWKLFGKIKKELSVADVVAKKVALIAAGESKWTIVSGGPAPVIIPSPALSAPLNPESISASARNAVTLRIVANRTRATINASLVALWPFTELKRC